MVEMPNPSRDARGGASRTSNQLLNVQILRFLAASSVVVFHALGTALKHMPDQRAHIFQIFHYGDHGVDMFFVISGFIICYSTILTKPTPLEFLFRRLQRIVPIYWLFTIAMVVLSILVPSAFSGTDWINAQSLLASMTFTSFAHQQFPIIFVGWSLEYEMLFYLTVFALLLRREKIWDGLIILFSLLTVLSFVPVGPKLQGISTFLSNPILIEFVYGLVVAKVFLGQRVSPLSFAMLITATLVVCASDPTNRLIVAGLPSAFLVLAAAQLSRGRSNPSRFERALGELGDASYSIYLLQVFVISGIVKVLLRFGGLPIDLIILIATLLTIAAGYLSYIGLERPLLGFFRRRRALRRQMISAVPSKST